MRRRALFSVLAATVPAALPAAPALAGDWTTEAGLGVGTYYSDNICLSNLGKQGQWVGTARPDVSINGSGGRFNMNLSAGVELNSLGESNINCAAGQGQFLTNRESVVPSINLNSDLELIRDWLTLEAEGFAGQNPINPFAGGGEDAINARENTNITYRYGVGARSERRIGDTGRFSARYNYNEQYNAIGQIGDSTQNSAQASLGTDPAAARLALGLDGSYSKVEFDDSDLQQGFDAEFATVAATATLRISRVLSLDARAGEEFNEFVSLDDDIDGTFWDAGFTWTPNARVSVAAGYGERFFGTTPRLNVSYRHKRSEFSASYQRAINLPRDLRGQQVDRGDRLADIEDLPGQPLGRAGRNTFIGQGPIENETLALNWGFQARRTGIGLNVSESKQTQFETGAGLTFRSAAITLTRQLGPQTSTDLRVGWRENEGDDQSIGLFGQELTAWTGSLGLSRTLGNETTLTLRYQYTNQDANTDVFTFTENRIDLNLRYRF
ncbi:MAG: TIGR03016 family PEP-CTERM system-associated outer membrane protein [Chromatocurvus sp.]